MALDDITPDEDDDDNKSKSTKRQYVQLSMEDFAECVSNIDVGFHAVTEDNTVEAILQTDEPVTDKHPIYLRIYTTLDPRTGKVRDKGKDAIRTVLWHEKHEQVVGGRTKTLRIKTYCKNLTNKIESILEETKDYFEECGECGGVMVKREGQYGEFYGCKNYPECDNTKQIED